MRFLILTLLIAGALGQDFPQKGQLNQPKCPRDSYQHRRLCYWKTRDPLSFQNAVRACAKGGGTLAAPADIESYAAIKEYVKARTHSYWIGLSADGDRGWVFSDGRVMGKDVRSWNWLWKMGEPTGPANKACGMLASAYDLRLVNRECHWGFVAICQTPLPGIEPAASNPVPTIVAPPIRNTNFRPLTQQPSTAVRFPSPAPPPDRPNQPLNPQFQPLNPQFQPPQRSAITCNTRELRAFQVKLPSNLETTKVAAGTSLQVSCVDGFVLHDDVGNVTCNGNGHWDMPDQICTSGCPRPPKLNPPLRLYDERPWYPVGHKLMFLCEDESVPLGGPMLCLDNGQWSEELPICRARSEYLCPDPLMSVTHSNVNQVTQGARVNLTCFSGKEAEDHKHVEVIWMKGQQVLNVGVRPDGTLELGPASEETEGLYTCIANVGRGRGLHTNSIQVVTSKDCNVGLDKTPEDAVVQEGEFTILSCSLRNALITWYKDGNQVLSDQKRQVLPNSALLLQGVTLSDAGQYTCVAEERAKRCKVSHTVRVSVEASDLEKICGQPRVPVVQAKGKVIGGKESVKNSHPWLVIIQKEEDGREIYLCGGNIVNSYWIVTAAHCFAWLVSKKEIGQLKVQIGKYNRTATEADERTFLVEKLIVHPQFDPDTFDNDIALLKLNSKIFFSNAALPICLPFSNFLSDYFPIQGEFSAGVVAGWGRIQEDGQQPELVRHVRLPLVAPEKCKGSTSQPVTKNMFCAGYDEPIGDTCQGDSGGPFEMVREGRTYLAGVVSWGEGCGRKGKFGFYTDISHYLEFIKEQVSTERISH